MYYTFNQTVKDQYKIVDQGILMFRFFSKDPIKFNGSLQRHQELRDFINQNRLPEVIPYDEKYENILLEIDDKAFQNVVMFIYDSNSTFNQSLFEIGRDILQKNSKEIKQILHGGYIITGDLANENFQFLLQQFNLTISQIPSIIIINFPKSFEENTYKYYQIQGSIDNENLRQFLQDYQSGKIEPIIGEMTPEEKSDDEDEKQPELDTKKQQKMEENSQDRAAMCQNDKCQQEPSDKRLEL